MIGIILAFIAVLYFISITISIIVAVGILLLPLIVWLLPFMLSATVVIALFFLTTLVLWLISENLLISFYIFTAIFALIWFVGDDTETIKKRLAKERSSSIHDKD